MSFRSLLPKALVAAGIDAPGDERGSARQTLARILLLRLFVGVTSLLGLLIFRTVSGITVPLTPIALIFVTALASVAASGWRLSRDWPVTTIELFAHLSVDVVLLVLVLLSVGGSSNPLISYLLVLLAVGATFLTPAFAYVFATACITIYTGFVVWDLRTEQMNHEMMSFQLHLVGMWVIFVVSALLIAVFVTRMAKAIRDRELTLAAVRENEIRNEQLVAIGTLAAGTAHALGTPLSTMAVLLTELDRMTSEDLRRTNVKEDISILKEQVIRCRNSLSQLTRYYNKEFGEPEAPIRVTEFADGMRDYLINVHPTAALVMDLNASVTEVLVPHDPNLNHAIINLIENSIKAARREVQVQFNAPDASASMLEITIRDDGPGVPASVMEKLGEPFISTNRNSMGLGIYLANATVKKLGGTIEMFNHKGGGATTIVRLPLHRSEGDPTP